MSCIPTAILWKIFYSHCLYVFIDCKNVSLALSCALVGWDGASGTLGGFAVVLGVPWEMLRVATLQHSHVQRISERLALNSSLLKKTICKSSCKKGKLLLEMDPRCLQRVKTSGSWIAKS